MIFPIYKIHYIYHYNSYIYIMYITFCVFIHPFVETCTAPSITDAENNPSQIQVETQL